ncbi:MAG: hypothetical protein BWY88_00612 [Synergistetes bacterium ADurb.Bin520]|nr:MAG: hypothetical protein BWY88_00612 [Synergistetes bacterium ADurb.Bin520]
MTTPVKMMRKRRVKKPSAEKKVRIRSFQPPRRGWARPDVRWTVKAPA